MAEQALVRRKCDYCDTTQEFPAHAADLTPEGVLGMTSWITLVKIYLVRQQLYTVQKHACKDSCAKNIVGLGMLGLPKELQEQVDADKRVADEFNRRLAKARMHPFAPVESLEGATGQHCGIEGCGLTAMAHIPPAAEA